MTVHSRVKLDSDHRRHDRLLVTRYAANDSYPGEQAEAEALVAACSDCARLAADIRLLVQRMPELPAPHRARDFRISADQAQKLRGSWLERLMRGIAAPGWGTALRPVAGAAFALGLTLMVVGALPIGGQPAILSDAGNSIQTRTTSEPAAIPAPSPESVSAPGMDAPDDPARDPQSAGVEGEGAQGPTDLDVAYLSTPEPENFSGQDGAPAALTSGNGSDLLLLVGSVLAALGALTLLVTWISRRRLGDVLLR